MQTYRNIARSRKSFTLVELLVVIAVISILAVIAVSFTSTARRKAVDAKAKTRVGDFLRGWIAYSSATSTYQDQCSTGLVMDQSNLTGPVSVTQDFIDTESVSPNLDTSDLYASTSPFNNCAYTSGQFTANAVAVGVQLNNNIAANAQNDIYDTNSVGGAVTGVFDTPNVGSNAWFVKTLP